MFLKRKTAYDMRISDWSSDVCSSDLVASFTQSRFLSDFDPLEVPVYSQSLLAVTPYVSGLYDNVGGGSDFEGGADIFWKPSGQFQFTATLNPDFGQVESDDLVVNFGATETFIGDKRPFFTENQGLFEYTTPSDYSQLLYTRRVGGPADDGESSGDITAAVKRSEEHTSELQSLMRTSNAVS